MSIPCLRENNFYKVDVDKKSFSPFSQYSIYLMNIAKRSKNHIMKKIHILVLTLFCLSFARDLKAQSKVTFYTSMGNFRAELYDTLQPITAGNFLSLIFFQFYDGIIFHRVIQGFVIQGGDPTGTGSGGPGYTIQDEFDPAARNVQRALAMANSGPNTGGSQFYINLVNNLSLDADYPVFGIVDSNFSVVQAIGNVPVNGSDRPLTNVVMDSVRVTQAYVPVSLDPNAGSKPLIEIYPNPVTEYSTIKVQAKSVNAGRISIYNQVGTAVYDKEIQLDGSIVSVSPVEIAQMNLSAGIYFLAVTDGVSVSKKKFVVLK